VYRECALCGKAFNAKRATAKYCGSSCRAKRSTRNKRIASLGAAGGEVVGRVGVVAPIADPSPDLPSSVFNMTQQTLVQAGKLASPQGATALIIAGRLDSSTIDTSAGIVALSRELDRLIANVLNAVERETPDELDELQRRRSEKAAKA
jgi:hypothetical protein